MLKLVERVLFIVGLATLALFFAGYSAPRLHAQQAIEQFEQTKALSVSEPNMEHWSALRVKRYRAESSDADAAIAVLAISSIAMEAPVFPGASGPVLDRGVGWIPGTTPVGLRGNVGLAGHRDGFFRGLGNIKVGDKISTSTLSGSMVYEVTGTDIVSPEDVYVLEPTAKATLTLVTCYPFYYVGSAPKRFVVFAVATNDPLA